MPADVFKNVEVHQLHVNEKIVNVHGQQAAAIADIPQAADVPTMAEFNALVDAFNLLLKAVRSGTGVGIVAND